MDTMIANKDNESDESLLSKAQPDSNKGSESKSINMKHKARRNFAFYLKIILLLICATFCFISSIFLTTHPLFNLLTKMRLQMTPGLPPFELWFKPKTQVFCSLYIFNVTNSVEFLNGSDDKMKLQEIGPIVYQEHFVHSDIEHHENSTMSYTIERYPEFLPDKNLPGILNQTIIVPNIVLMGIVSRIASASFAVKMPFNILSRSDPAFVNTTIYNYLWNLTTPALITIDKFLPFMVPQDNGAILHSIYQNFKDRVNVRIGPKYGFSEFFMINTFNGRDTVPGYRPERGDCVASIVNSTEGAIYSNFLEKDRIIYYWRKTVCRPIPLHYEKEVKKGYLTGYKFVTRPDMYDRSRDDAKDCYSGFNSEPLPDGLSDTSKCYNGLPIAMSLPHFYGRSGYWEDRLEGLNPHPDKHLSFAIIEPINGVPLAQTARSQSNMVIPKLYGFHPTVSRFSEMVLPLTWLEYKLIELPTHITVMLIFTSNVLPYLQYFLPIVFLILGIMSALSIVKRLCIGNNFKQIYRFNSIWSKENIYTFDK